MSDLRFLLPVSIFKIVRTGVALVSRQGKRIVVPCLRGLVARGFDTSKLPVQIWPRSAKIKSKYY